MLYRSRGSATSLRRTSGHAVVHAASTVQPWALEHGKQACRPQMLSPTSKQNSSVSTQQISFVRLKSSHISGIRHPVRRGKLFGFVSEDHNGATFVDLLDIIDACYPTGRGHIVCDNLSIHDADDVLDWFEEHTRWTRHFTPKHASWLNQIECMFAILHRHVPLCVA